MTKHSLNGTWKIRWSTGQRGGTPYVIKFADEHDYTNEVEDKPRELPGSYDERGWLDATVPGEVHLDLMRHGILDDVYVGINVFKARWVEECVWHYRRTFDAPPEALSERTILRFDGIDLTSIIYLNGREIARHNNAFTPCLVDVTGKLKPTDNELLVRVESGLYDVCERPIRELYTATATVDVLLHKRVWMRKVQSQTEWDWSPRLLNVGLFGDVSLLTDSSVVVGQSSLRQQVSGDLSSAVITGRMFAASGGRGQYRLVIETDGKREECVCDGIGKDGVSVSVRIDNPRLWWPNGYGKQPLYPVTLTLYEGEREIHRYEQAIGLRHVKVKQPPHPEKGHYFIIEINHVPIFFKGANLVPNDMITAAITRDRYETLVDRALEANFNMLRVWGGGLYESDDLYELCDRRGILVWQEFISACGEPPIEDPAMLKNVTEEAIYQLRRLSCHASLVVWCGNNEVTPYHSPLFMEIYPALVVKEDPEKYYQPASPYTNNNLARAPKNDNWYEFAGDQHPWEVGFTEKDHRKYRQMQCRFPNEGGILGPTSIDTMLDCTEDIPDFTETMSFQVHDNMEHYWKPGSSPDDDAKFWLNMSPREMTLTEYVMAGGYVQGEGLTDYIDNFRRRKFDSASAIFWMYNDCWPCPRSWTIVDYHLHRTPSFYHVKRAFNPLRVVAVRQADGSVTIYGVNGTMYSFSGSLRYGVFTCDGQYVRDDYAAVTLPANASTPLAVIPKRYVSDKQHIPFAILTDGTGAEISRNRLLDLRFYEYPLGEATIRVTADGEDTILEADNFVMGVCLDIRGDRSLTDNQFDLYPHIPYRLKNQSVSVILDTLNDVLRRHGKITEG